MAPGSSRAARAPLRHARLVGYGRSAAAVAAAALCLLVLAPKAAAFQPLHPFATSTHQRRQSSSSKMQAAADGGESLLSPLLGQVATSKTIEIHAMTKAMEARGEEVVSLCVGEPDFPPPPGACVD